MGLKVENYTPVPQPPGMPVLGNLFDVDTGAASTSFFNLAREYGEIFKLNAAGFVVFSVNSAELVTEVSSDDRFRKLVEGALVEMRDAVHNGLLTAETNDPVWKTAHHIAMPSLTPVTIREQFEGMKDITTQMCLRWARLGPSNTIDVNNNFMRLALDIIGLCGFRYRFNSFYDANGPHPIAVRLNRFLMEVDARQWRLPFMNSFYFSKKRQYLKDIKYMRELCQGMIDTRRKEGLKYNDILGALIAGKDPESGKGLDDHNLVDNLVTILAAGHETTSGTLSFALYFLTQHPEALIKAQREVDEVIGNDSLAVDHLSKLPYLDAVIRETLRFQPTVPLYSRTCDEDQVLAGKYFVPKNTPIILNVIASHRDPKVYGDDVDQWKPERMLGDNFKKLPIGAWRAFGTGIRACIGRAFAWQEMQVALAMLLHSFNFEAVDPNYKLRCKDAITLNPLGFEICARLRDESKYSALLKDSGSEAETVSPTGDVHGLDTDIVPRGRLLKVYYGSDNGMAQSLAYLFATHAKSRGFVAEVQTLNAAKENLSGEHPTIIFTSSYNGEPPLTATHFVSWLQTLSGSQLEGVSYAVFGCGHRDWSQTFQRVPTVVDELLSRYGATRIAPLAYADAALGDTLSEFQDWEEQTLWPILGLSQDMNYAGETVNGDNTTMVIPGLMLPKQDFKPAYISDVSVLTQPQAAAKLHMELDLPAGSTYNVGDYIAIAPVNQSTLVQRVLQRFNIAWDSKLKVEAGKQNQAFESQNIANEILANSLELDQPASTRNIRYLAGLAVHESSAKGLAELEVRNDNRASSVLDLLEKYRDINITIEQYLSLLPPLHARTYSISSSPLANPVKATITWSVVTKAGNPDDGKARLGVASNYLAGLKPGSMIRHSIRNPRTDFKLPTNSEDTPVIMIAAGSGIAPFRGFVQERYIMLKNGRRVAPAVLFFGCRAHDADDLYRKDFDTWQDAGAVTVYRAFSRPSDGRKEYVQDLLPKHKALLQELWGQNARTYVCGASKMADDAKRYFEDIVGEFTEADLKASRFLTEIFS